MILTLLLSLSFCSLRLFLIALWKKNEKKKFTQTAAKITTLWQLTESPKTSVVKRTKIIKVRRVEYISILVTQWECLILVFSLMLVFVELHFKYEWVVAVDNHQQKIPKITQNPTCFLLVDFNGARNFVFYAWNRVWIALFILYNPKTNAGILDSKSTNILLIYHWILLISFAWY